ncbi:MAG: RHS repeat-associated core domain-containing protein, partial [Spirochaetaceae bacterium]|nr:RHS repeat-associated core domain-containing protein [Spirochaetaceae bacterium]
MTLNVKNLYDGFSFDVLGKSVLQSAYSANVPAQKYRDGQSGHPELVSGSTHSNRTALGSEIGTRYRYIDETPLVPLTEAGKANGTNATASASGAKTRSRPNNEYVLYSFGEPVAMTNDSGTSYFGTDILGSVRNVTDKYGTVQSDYSYDAFGSPYLGNLENDIGFGYCGKVYDVGTGLYDYGFRDYSPVSARFTTIDPIRDGSNWFSYVVNDPVNYVDPLGLNPVSDLIDGVKEKGAHLINNVKKTGKDAIGFLKDKYIELFDPKFLNSSPHVLIAIPEHPENVKSSEVLIIERNNLYLNPYDAIYDPLTGTMYKAADGQSVA